jgi:tetratricopeptide (TPR) repeat protein
MRHLHITTFFFLMIFSATAQVSQQKARDLAQQGNFQEAISIIDQLIAQDPHHASYYGEKAGYLIGAQAYEDALKALTTGIHLMPDSAMLYDARGTLLEAFRLYKDAIADFTLGYEKAYDPRTRSHILMNRGGTKVRIRDFEGSYSDLVLALKLDSTNIDVLNNLSAVCDEVNKPDETLKYLERIIRIDPTHVPAYVNLGFKYQKMASTIGRSAILTKLWTLTPKNPWHTATGVLAN